MGSEFLNDIYKYIISQDDEKILRTMIRNRRTSVSEEEYLCFVDLFSERYRKEFEHCITFSGSGGSGIYKPNLSSIASLYIAAIGMESVVKVGSSAIHGLSGSTDFFEEIGIYPIKNKIGFLDKYNFTYFDISEISPWTPYRKILCSNESIRNIYNNYSFHFVKTKVEITGVISKNMAEEYLNKKHYNKPDALYTFYSMLEPGVYIDEVIPGQVYLDGNKFLNIPKVPFHVCTNLNMIKHLNQSLLEGTCESLFWLEALKYSVAIGLLLSNSVLTIDEGINLFEKIYRDLTVSKIIKSMNNDNRKE